MKRIILSITMLVICLSVNCQKISVDSIVAFYRNTDIDCYKEKLYQGMKEYDCWLVDTFPRYMQLLNGLRLCPIYSPSRIDVREHEVIQFVALNYYNMENYSYDDNIYDHVILDSTKCFLFVLLDEKGKPMGITEWGDHFTYKSFADKEDIDYQFMRQFRKHLKSFLKTSRKQKAEALVILQAIGGKYHDLGFVKDGRIFFCWPEPVELNSVIQQDMKNGKLDIVHNLDVGIVPEYREGFFKRESTIKTRAGHSEKRKLRICL